MVKKILPWFVFITLFALLIIGFSVKDKMNSYLSVMIKEQASFELISSEEAMLDSLFNYTINGLSYEVTFLEFGAKGCSACKRMETVMEEIRTLYPNKVNVVFLNILMPENLKLMKYFGIAAIPTQVLLDKNAEEFFRHTGFYSSDELIKKSFFSDKVD